MGIETGSAVKYLRVYFDTDTRMTEHVRRVANCEYQKQVTK
jgi:hypothetical protein